MFKKNIKYCKCKLKITLIIVLVHLAGFSRGEVSQIETDQQLRIANMKLQDKLSEASHVKKNTTRGKINSKNKATLSAGITGKILSIAGDVGDYVPEGAELVVFKCDRYDAVLAHAQAVFAGARARKLSVKSLLEFNSIGPVELELAQAELDKAEAQRKVSVVDVNNCTIVAPYDLVIIERYAHPHQISAEGEPILRVYEPDVLEVHWLAPSYQLQSLHSGDSFSVHIEELERSFVGAISRLGAVVDPVSQTVDVFGEIRPQATSTSTVVLRPGMSGWVQLEDRKK